MASLLSLLPELLPIIKPGEVISVQKSEIDKETSSGGDGEGTGQTQGMARKPALVGKSRGLCATVMVAGPRSCSAVHHHGEQDTIVYAVRGQGLIVTNPSNDESGLKKTPLGPGDFALIPAYCEHQEVNEGDEEVEWIITRSGSTPVVVNLDGWGGKEVKD